MARKGIVATDIFNEFDWDDLSWLEKACAIIEGSNELLSLSLDKLSDHFDEVIRKEHPSFGTFNEEDVEPEPSELPAEMKNALKELYDKFSSNPSVRQKIEILERELGGQHNIYYMGAWKDTEEQRDKVRLGVLELSWLEENGLYFPIAY